MIPWNCKKIYKICAFKPLAYTSRFYIFLINSILFQKFLAKSRIVKGTLSSTSFSIFIPVISSITRTAFLSTFSNDAFAFTFQSNYQQKYYPQHSNQSPNLDLNICFVFQNRFYPLTPLFFLFSNCQQEVYFIIFVHQVRISNFQA